MFKEILKNKKQVSRDDTIVDILKEQKVKKIMRLVKIKERRIGRLIYLGKKDGSKIKY